MIERFDGEDGKRRLVGELRNQTIVLGSDELALAIADGCDRRSAGGILDDRKSG